MAMKTNEEYIKKLANVNPNIEVIGKYIELMLDWAKHIQQNKKEQE